MQKNSLFMTITLVFFVTFAVMAFAFYQLYITQKMQFQTLKEKRTMQVGEMIKREAHHGKIEQSFMPYFAMMDFAVEENLTKIKSMLEDPMLVIQSTDMSPAVEIIKMTSAKADYLLIQTQTRYLLLKDMIQNRSDTSATALLFMGILGLFGLFYFYTIKKLYPLKKLQKSVRLLGQERYEIDCASDQKDEISELANEFDKTAKKLKYLKEARNVFIRNIMHELKTPIAKGKFLVELPQNGENKEKMKALFYRLESLIGEFATIESLIAGGRFIHKKSCYLEDVVDNAIDTLMCDEDRIIRQYDNLKLEVDFRLFSIAIKNLIDNAIKYSHDQKATIKAKPDHLRIENHGKPFAYPLEAYFEPFFKGNETSFKRSFGLGLYIVKHIVDAHGFEIAYAHENGCNIIEVMLKKPHETALL